MKLNSFGEAIARVEAERMAESKAAIDAGWTEADHPTKCCPAKTVTPQPKRAGRSAEELERLRAVAQRKAEWWNDEFTRRQQAHANHDATQPRFDHGMLNTDLKARQRASTRSDRLWKAQQHAQERAQHFWNLEAKYAEQLSKRRD